MTDILLIDGDAAARRAMADGLAGHGHAVTSLPLSEVGTALSGLAQTQAGLPDAVVIDPCAAGTDSVLILRLLRMAAGRPVLVTAAGLGDTGVARLLAAGADAHARKPCSAALVSAMLRAILRRVPSPVPAPARVIGQLRLDAAAREATLSGQPLQLTAAEFDLLACLSEHPGRVLSRAMLGARLRPGRRAAPARSVDVLLSRLRAKLGEHASAPRYLHSTRGHGVALREP
ncbi:response regulator transcription factor [Longispora albida]|uniref:response regulator transcription factor n=1 Tax=Longispora albida TaxID=203523 RepID=UPI0003700F63|nr:response regulator transcription factor [Longispora albida]